MHQISIPDPLYAKAERAAIASGMSVESIVREAVASYLSDYSFEARSLKLTDEQAELIRRTQAEVQAGHVLTMEQVEQRNAESRTEWLKANPH